MTIQPLNFKRRRIIHAPGGDSRVQPHFAPECGIKAIMEKHRALGLKAARPLDPSLCGVASRYTFAEAFAMVETANNAFKDLPARLRDRFKNDPAQLMDFLNNEDNRAEAIELGLLNKPEVPPLTAKAIAEAVAAATKQPAPAGQTS